METNNNATQTSVKDEVFITHIFNAPRELVFRAWTEPEHLLRWYAPDNCTITFKKIDVRPGGVFHSCVYNPQYGDCWISGVYQEVIFPERLVFSMALADEEGNLVASAVAGKDEDWPEQTITTVTFTALGDKTRLTLHQTVSEAKAKQTGAYQSWIEMFNRLNNIVADLPQN
ncbi:SRPBCC family protein [Mucilaginibacter pocheonensis]|uniref:Uncharacterized protein YndB with AHSA1/START domain n=1 Tax=Mucilaginibacter pocheonensis TaxID=398050 RepID=A0ABU1T6S6_9SPHI|nr:SRPBCC domain-containing protein [Mucilaginibacter pocheonensis]MDR6941082.1 uncharacterized protein YndB with AHSA1/START domain [Mucilaginibacter pocheonensis]